MTPLSTGPGLSWGETADHATFSNWFCTANQCHEGHNLVLKPIFNSDLPCSGADLCSLDMKGTFSRLKGVGLYMGAASLLPLPETIRLSVCPSVHMSVCLSVSLSVQ